MQLQQQLAQANQIIQNNKNYNNNFSSNQINKSDIFIKIVSQDQSIDKVIKCSENEPFDFVEEKLLQYYPQLRNKKIAFIANGTKISKYNTIKENNINNGTKIICILNDNDSNDNIYNDNNNYFNNYNDNNINNNNNISYSNNGQNFNNGNQLNNNSNINDFGYITTTTTNPMLSNTFAEVETSNQVPEINTLTTTMESTIPSSSVDVS
jgi:hypothetical protein